MKLATLAGLALSILLYTGAASAASMVPVIEVEDFKLVNGKPQVTIGGQTETLPMDDISTAFCQKGKTAVEVKSDVYPAVKFIVKFNGKVMSIGDHSIKIACPPNFDVAVVRAALVAKTKVYGWNAEKVVKPLLEAFDAGKFSELVVKVNPNTNASTFKLWTTVYGKRWSDGNMRAHLRDEHPAGVNVIQVFTKNRRYTILMDGCGAIEKISVGVKSQPKPRVKPRTKRTPRPQPATNGLGPLPTIVCTKCN